MNSRTILALSANVEKLWLWELLERPIPNYGLHPIFGNLRLMNESLTERFPSYPVYQRMANRLNGINRIWSIPVKQQNVFLFGLERDSQAPFYVIWERRDWFTGEDQPPNKFLFEIKANEIRLTDVFGASSSRKVSNGRVEIEISATPIYIDALN
jgi:hypothetical protein